MQHTPHHLHSTPNWHFFFGEGRVYLLVKLTRYLCQNNVKQIELLFRKSVSYQNKFEVTQVCYEHRTFQKESAHAGVQSSARY